MSLQLTHVFRSHLDLSYGDAPLFRYIYQPTVADDEAPKPYFHPLYTLDGNPVTAFRPYDHKWHHGLAMTMAVLSGQNFWGGGTYVHGQGYVDLPNHGRIEHRGWQFLDCTEDEAVIQENLRWINSEGVHWISETRKIKVNEVNSEAGFWVLDQQFDLTNVRSEALRFGSPTTEGRPMAGYGSLFWRGPRSFLNGRILAANDLEGPEIMGQSSPWLAFSGSHDGSGQQSTLLFIDQPDNPRYPTQWFVRNTPYACLSLAFTFDEEYILEPGDVLTLNYRLVVINGAWSRDQIEQFVARLDG